MTPFKLTVLTPEKVFFDDEATEVIVRSTEGDIGILAGHIALVAALPPGALKVRQGEGELRVAAVSGGIVKVGYNRVRIFVDAAEWADEIDENWARRSEEDARRRLEEKANQHDIDLAEMKLKRALNRLSVKNNGKNG
ncbi:MAG: ATP synthase F1 subunit epsilon [Oscillospiraceae bacterium]|nr:ATP synthase F1 subunit epsilon [Oscillospiraceae bacterium]